MLGIAAKADVRPGTQRRMMRAGAYPVGLISGGPAKVMRPHVSGRCISTTPWGDQTQLSSRIPGSRFPCSSRESSGHWTREKFIRQISPGAGGMVTVAGWSELFVVSLGTIS
ncbi:MAG: hypothetical protein RL215_1154 [Planctomycetota bacterium]